MRYIIGALMVVMMATAAWSHPVYGPSGEITGETLETHEYGFSVPPGIVQLPYRSDEIDPNGRVEVSLERLIISGYDLTEILTECLEFVPDGSDIEHEPPSCYLPAIYEQPTPIIEPGPITKMQAELDRLKRQTELHHKIKEILKILKGGNQ